MKTLLVVAWEMPPLSGPRAIQVTRTLQQLAVRGWRARVVCFGPRSTRYNQDHDVSLERTTGGAVQLIRVASPEEWFAVRALWRVCPPLKQLPDEKRVWIHGAVDAAMRAIDAEPADLIVSFAQPWSDHLIGLELHRRTRVPWVAHFSDPWVDSPYLRGAWWQRRIWTRMEREVIADASRVVFVNRQTADRVMAKYPAEWGRKARVVPQGFGAGVLPQSPARGGGPLRVVYTGRFYDGVRTPDTFLRALASVNRRSPLAGRIEVEFVGGAMEAYQRAAAGLGLNGAVTFTGRLPPEWALARAAAADVLLVIDAPSDGPNMFLPSKVVDYLGMKKPILGLTPRDGATADLLRSLDYPIVHPQDPAAIAVVIEQLMADHALGRLAPARQHDEVARAYDIRETTKTLADVFLEAMAVQ